MHIGNGQTAAALEAWIHAKRHVGIITIAAPPDCFEAELLSPDFGIAGEADTVTCRDKDLSLIHISFLRDKWECTGECADRVEKWIRIFPAGSFVGVG